MNGQMNRSKLAAEVQDDNGRTRGYLEPMGGGWYHVYLGPRGEYVGAGKTLQAAIDMITEKSGMDYEALPPVKRADLTIKRGKKNKIVGFQGGGFYRVDTVEHNGKFLGTLHVKEQPARRINTASTNVNGYGVMGHDLAWMCRQHGLRLED